MDAIEQGINGNHAAESFDEDSLSSCLPKICDIYKESFIFPHIGEQYQAETPPIETKSVLFQSSYDSKTPAIDGFGIGLAIPVNWVQYAVDNININCEKKDFSNMGIVPGMGRLAHLQNNSSSQADYKFNTRESALENPKRAGKLVQNFACEIEFLNALHQDIHIANSANHVMGDDDQKDYSLPLVQSKNAGNFYPFPGLPTQSWSDADKQSFLLGLYIFGKNLVQVKKFMENKRMGDVLSFYYGKFYRSDEYHRWSECRKIRSRRSINGQRIFTGWRQQELLSRILSSASKELHDTLLEATKAFNEGKVTMENFVFKLKAVVGLQVLVEAIGIGKGTLDLTRIAFDHVRTSATISLHPEIPVGRACSSLKSADIIKFLTGDFRLSKSRSNDLFWEAVWPRLLARGWHSEQPRDHGSLGFKNFLVFLVPGVKKFSRKRLVKGAHFFDSVSDVLSKVASDPKLLDLDVEGVKCSSSVKEENGWNVNTKVCQNGSSLDQQRHFYLHPRRPSCNSERMKFTIVDTSLVQREGSFELIKIRSLPLGSNSRYDPSADSQESTSGSSSSEREDSTYISDDSNHGSFAEKKREENRATHSELPETLMPFPNTTTTTNRYVSGGRTDGRTYSVIKRVQQDMQQMNSKAATTLFPNASPFQMRTNLYHSSKGNAENRNIGQTNLPEDNKLKSQTFLDLNNLPPDADVTESSSNVLKAEELPQSSAGKQQVSNQVSVQDYNDDPSHEQPSTGIRRQSTRNRPPTAKALEALANGLLGTKRSWRPFKSKSRLSQKAKIACKEPASVSAANLCTVAYNNFGMNVTETVRKDYDTSARKGTHEFLELRLGERYRSDSGKKSSPEQ